MKERNSSVELFRIIAAFLVLIVHWNGWFVGGMPEMFNGGGEQLAQSFIQAASSVCVNCFILISGFFGVNLKWKPFVSIFLVLLFIKVPSFLLVCLYQSSFDVAEFFDTFLVFSRAGYFVQCYLLLIFCSPLLNSFIASNNRKTVLYWTIVFFLIEFLFDHIRHIDCLGFGDGYSILHFILIYFIGRLMYLYFDKISLIKKKFYLFGYVSCVCSSVIIFCLLDSKSVFLYTSPLTILSSVFLFIPFLCVSFHSKIINWVAPSTFAVYIIQVTFPYITLLKRTDIYLVENYSYMLYWLISLGVLILFFFFCVIYDKAISLLIKPMTVRICEKLEKHHN